MRKVKKWWNNTCTCDGVGFMGRLALAYHVTRKDGSMYCLIHRAPLCGTPRPK